MLVEHMHPGRMHLLHAPPATRTCPSAHVHYWIYQAHACMQRGGDAAACPAAGAVAALQLPLPLGHLFLLGQHSTPPLSLLHNYKTTGQYRVAGGHNGGNHNITCPSKRHWPLAGDR